MNKGYDSGPRGFDVEPSHSPIQDDATAQEQYLDGIGGARFESSEKQLMLAILTDAVRCVSQSKWSKASSDALNWVVEPEQDHVCSFGNICEVLGPSPTTYVEGFWQMLHRPTLFLSGFVREDRAERRCQYESPLEEAVDSKSGINRKGAGMDALYDRCRDPTEKS